MIDWTVIKAEVLGGTTVEFIISFCIFSTLGMILSLMWHFKSKMSRNKKKNIKQSFNLIFWFKDNLVRIITNYITIFIVARFYQDLPLKVNRVMLLALVTGICIDQVIVFIRKKTNFELFQTKEV